MPQNRTKKPSKSDVEASIYSQLDLSQSTRSTAVFRDLVETYMRLYDVKEKLLRDIKTRGTKVEQTLSTGVVKTVTNESVRDVMDVQSQMLQILDKLKLKPPEPLSRGSIDVDM